MPRGSRARLVPVLEVSELNDGVRLGLPAGDLQHVCQPGALQMLSCCQASQFHGYLGSAAEGRLEPTGCPRIV